jgi:hypothetical protein
VSGRRDKVEQGVDSIVPEPRITLDTRLFGQDIIVLALEVADNFLETAPWGSVTAKLWV